MTDPIKHCCKAFEQLLGEFKWFYQVDAPALRGMPCIYGTDYRVNFCPSCGANVRAIEINEDGDRTA